MFRYPRTPQAAKAKFRATHLGSTSPIRKNINTTTPVQGMKGPFADAFSKIVLEQYGAARKLRDETREQWRSEKAQPEKAAQVEKYHKKTHEPVKDHEPRRFRRSSIKSAIPSQRLSLGRGSSKSDHLNFADEHRTSSTPDRFGTQRKKTQQFIESFDPLPRWQSGRTPSGTRIKKIEKERKRSLDKAEQYWRDTEIRKFLEDQEKSREFEESIWEH